MPLASRRLSIRVGHTEVVVQESPSSDGDLVIRLQLSRTTAPANGTPIPATLTVLNHTGRPVPVPGRAYLNATSGPGGWIQVGLTNAQVPYEPLFEAIMHTPLAQLPVGTSTYPTVVSTTWYACGGGPPFPDHPEGRGMPSLAAGTYTTKVVSVLGARSAGWQPSDPITVTLVAP